MAGSKIEAQGEGGGKEGCLDFAFRGLCVSDCNLGIEHFFLLP